MPLPLPFKPVKGPAPPSWWPAYRGETLFPRLIKPKSFSLPVYFFPVNKYFWNFCALINRVRIDLCAQKSLKGTNEEDFRWPDWDKSFQKSSLRMKRGNKKDLLWLTLQSYSKKMNQITSETSKNSGQCLRSTMKREIEQNSMSK